MGERILRHEGEKNPFGIWRQKCVLRSKVNSTICLVSKEFKVNRCVFTVKSTQSEYNRLTVNSCVGNMINIGLLKYNKECQPKANQFLFGTSPIIFRNYRHKVDI